MNYKKKKKKSELTSVWKYKPTLIQQSWFSLVHDTVPTAEQAQESPEGFYITENFQYIT